MWRNPGSGPEVAYRKRVTHDWGTIPPGDSFTFVAMSLPLGTPYFVCPVTSAPSNCLTLGLSVVVDQVPALLLQCTNTSGSPLLVGPLDYDCLVLDPTQVALR